MNEFDAPTQMNSNGAEMHSLPVRRSAVSARPVHLEPVDDSNAIDFYALFHRALRGRYLTALLLACAGGIVGAAAGYFATRPQYKSEGLIKIAYSMPAVLQETDQNKPMAMFDSFIRSQQMRMTSRELIVHALASPEWTATKQGNSVSMIADFADHLVVDHPGGTEHLRVSFTDPDPVVASAAVHAVISTFQATYLEDEQHLQKQRLSVLNDRKHELSQELNTVGSRADQLAQVDSTLSEYLKRQVALETELKMLEAEGYLPNHRRVADLHHMLERTGVMIQQYSAMARKMHEIDRDYASLSPADPNPFRNSGSKSDGADSQGDLMSVQGNMLQMQRLQGDSENIRKELSDTTQRIDSLKIESGVGTRLEVVSDGDVPLTPFRDRRSLFALAGACAGAAAPWMFFAVIGTIRPTYRRSEDAVRELADRLPHLGTLPALTSRGSDPVMSAGAAHSIHQTRVKLQMLRDRHGMRTFLVTSPCGAEGKTTLTTSLGLSFAASGSRTLLIDLDFVGRRLSRGFRCERREGAYEALGNVDARGRVREVTPGLWIMPAGIVDSQQASTISSTALRAVVDQLHDAFDVILIDSGPVLGSVETSIAASVVDGIVLTISRGQEPWRVDRTIEHLTSLGGKMAGLIFNRADAREFSRASIWPSVSQSRAERAQAKGAPRNEAALKADLIVQSVMTFLPTGFIGPDSHIHQALPDPPPPASKSAPMSVDTETPDIEPLPA